MSAMGLMGVVIWGIAISADLLLNNHSGSVSSSEALGGSLVILDTLHQRLK